nr:hydrogenase [synthetic construct]
MAGPTAECDCPPAPAPKAPHWQQTLDELAKPKEQRKVMIAQIAPAVRVAIAETMGLNPGDVTVGQMVTGLRMLGFDYVFDTLFAADLTIMEEGTELLHRLKEHLEAHPHSDEPLPMFTSCCPGWVAMMEKSYPELIPFVSSCKSPQMMLAAMVKSYLAEKKGIAPKDMVMVSIMPCTRKQSEADRDWFCVDADPTLRQLDHVITTVELGNIFVERGIKLNDLQESPFDNPVGEGSGGGVLFGTTGGVMEAALRTVYEVVTQKPLDRIVFEDVRGLDGIKEASVTLVPAPGSKFAELVAERLAHKVEEAAAAEAAAAVEGAVKPPIAYDGGQGFSTDDGTGITLNIAVANGLGNAKKLIKQLAAGESKYDFIEVMACPGGCIGGGGQPRSADKQILQKRQAALYNLDEKSTLRRSHENPSIRELYDTYLGEPLGHKAHELLHTHYVAGGVEEKDEKK